MKGSFFAGIALGALMGAMLLDVSPQTKSLVEKGKDVMEQQVRNATK